MKNTNAKAAFASLLIAGISFALSMLATGCATMDYRYEFRGVNGQSHDQLLSDNRACKLAAVGKPIRPGAYLNTPATNCMRSLGYELVAIEVQ